MKSLVIIILLLTTFNRFCQGQITIDFPKERQVFQRENVDFDSNVAGDGDIHISGNFTVEYDSIMARVEPRIVGQGTATAWSKINARNGKPYFLGKLNVKGGWYSLYVHAYENGSLVGADTINRVGMGEVFAIAGQSNAQGGDDLVTGFHALDDRVSAIDYDNDSTVFNKLAIGFSKIDRDSSSLGPFHFVPWAWGKLGDFLTTSLNVPVLFYGAAHGGTKVIWWKEAAKSEPLTGAPFYVKENLGAPYMALRMTLNFYASLTGLRGVIWHQGEADQNTATADYRTYLEQLIAESRIDSEHSNLAWMVCRVSFSNGGTSVLPIIAQDEVIANDVNVYAGPNTDELTEITGHRETVNNVHFNNLGLIEFAKTLDNYLNENFYESTVPLLASDFIELNYTCDAEADGNPISLSPASAYDAYAWSNRNNNQAETKGYSNSASTTFINYPPASYDILNWQYDSTNSISSAAGKYSLNVRKATSEKVLFSPLVDLQWLTTPTIPTFSSSHTQIRPLDTLTLTGSNCNSTYLWSPQAEGNPLKINPIATTTYTLTCKTLHCLSSLAAPVEVLVSSCFSDPLNLSGMVSTAESAYQSTQNLTSTQTLSNSGSINYSASQTVELLPGFLAEDGSLFKATIEDCN